jgi:hypothetical protein
MRAAGNASRTFSRVCAFLAASPEAAANAGSHPGAPVRLDPLVLRVAGMTVHAVLPGKATCYAD